MDNTTNNLMLNAFMEAVNAHISSIVEARLNKLLSALPALFVADVDAKVIDIYSNHSIMGTLDKALEQRLDEKIREAVNEHTSNNDHKSRDDIAEIAQEVVEDSDGSAAFEAKVLTVLKENSYTDEEYVDGIFNDGSSMFVDAVRSVLENEITLKVTVG